MKRLLALSVALLLLAGCAGGGGGASSVPASSQTSSKTTQGSVTISIPVASGASQATARNARFPQFVSPSAFSVALSINGGADTIFDVSPTSPLCTTVAGSRNCTLAFSAPAGSDHFAFLIFAGPNATGATLASSTTNQTIVTGQAFAFTLAMNAVIGVVAANLVGNNTGNCYNAPQNGNNNNIIVEGCPGSGTLSFTVTDPSGAVITGPAAFAGGGLTITPTDPAISAVPAQITAPGQNSVLSYAGSAFASTVTTQINVSLTVGTVVIPFSIPVLRQYLYVAHSNTPFGAAAPGGGNITVYTYGASGAAAPVRTLSGATSGITTPLKPLVDTSGTLYVLDINTQLSPGVFNPTIRVFAPGATGNVAPIRQITGLGTLSGNQACSDIIFNPSGAFLFVSCANKIFVFPVLANGTATGTTVASFPVGTISNGMAFDPSGNLLVADQADNAIFIVSGPVPTSGGAQVVGGGSSMDGGAAWSGSVMPFFLAVDNMGTLFAPVWFQNATSGPSDAQAELAMWRNGNICNNCNPSAFFTGAPFTTQHALVGIVLDSVGNVYVGNPFTDLVTEFSPATIAGASLGSTATGQRTLNNNSTGVIGSTGMAIGP